MGAMIEFSPCKKLFVLTKSCKAADGDFYKKTIIFLKIVSFIPP